MQASQRSFLWLIVIVLPSPFGVVPQLNMLPSRLSSERPLCCLALLSNSSSFVQFSRCDLSDSLRSDISL